ncbi:MULTISPECIES: NAD(P)H-hydrate dehydratase [unclassified Acidovorax]|uniref:NAD(P)H-hydrate dehydratase n=1 Tax=unclassified Acidovorax TaxID=2684926 RepID=UPI0028832970|nr:MULTISPECIES: NAD(P)H-hydrate dehydratase [unclassified Acidovorax]
MLQRITSHHSHLLHDTAATRRLEQSAAAQCPAHTFMQRAGLALARLAQALAPHAPTIWLACGSGNNGGDGLEAAANLRRAGRHVVVTWLGTAASSPADALASWQRAQDAGVTFLPDAPEDLGQDDLCIDALLGIGLSSALRDRPSRANLDLLRLLQRLQTTAAPVLCVDAPSGLLADTGQFAPGLEPVAPASRSPRHTLSLLTLKPGLFTGMGRDVAGTVWLDDLGASPGSELPSAQLTAAASASPRAHATHKGSFGDVAIVGGEGLQARGMGMTGAALLAASAALHGGAGRVMLSLLDAGALQLDALQPECMLRRFDALALEALTVVCGCGGGDAVRTVLPSVLRDTRRLVLDADALNAIAQDPALGEQLADRASRQGNGATVLTPHPLEAARLLDTDTRSVQADRLRAARQLAERYRCAVVLKGSGSVVTAPGQVPRINPTGNGLLATGGTGDVLAGLLGALLAAMPADQAHAAFLAAERACWLHGSVADHWPADKALTASELARALRAH